MGFADTEQLARPRDLRYVSIETVESRLGFFIWEAREERPGVDYLEDLHLVNRCDNAQ